MIVPVSLFLALIMSVDVFVLSLSLACDRVSVTKAAKILISGISCIVFTASLLIGRAFKDFMPVSTAAVIGCIILCAVGFLKLTEGLVKTAIKNGCRAAREISFKLFSCRFILNVFAEPVLADSDKSRVISARESVSLALILALDGAATGFGSALTEISIPAASASAFVFAMAFFYLGEKLGNRLSAHPKLNMSVYCGIALIVLGVSSILI